MAWSFETLSDLSEEQHKRWQELLEERTGIFFSEHQTILQAGLRRRMREVGCSDYEEYYDHIRNGQLGVLEWGALVSSITVKETSFFRHTHAFKTVHRFLRQRLEQQQGERGSLELWSVGCATGEEPYSLAIITKECLEQAESDWLWGVTGTDICSTALERARAGQYSISKLDRMPRELCEQYFNETNDRVEVCSDIRERLCFVQANIMNMESHPLMPMDVIFCQNVLIYFRRWKQREVLDTLADHLKPGGLLIVGLGEAVDWRHPKMSRTDDPKVQAYIRQV